jgi:hypothetical protein
MVVLAMLVIYPLIGTSLTVLMAGKFSLDPAFIGFDQGMLFRFRMAQGLGQILALGLPVFWLARSQSGGRGAFDRMTLSWLGLRRPARWGALLQASFGMLLLQPLMYSIVELQNLVIPFLGETGRAMLRDQARLEEFIRKISASGSVPEFLMVSAVLVLIPAVCEELFFRGFVQKSYAAVFSPKRAVILTGFVFALFHMEVVNIIPLTLLGWYIGYIYMRSGDLSVPASAHATNNLLALLFLIMEPRINLLTSTVGGSTIVAMWQWWVFVSLCLGAFFMLMLRFSKMAASAKPDNLA